MIRTKTFDTTGVPPGGRLFAGDLNAIEDAAAALVDLTQNLQVGTVTVGETGLQLIRFGTAEARLTGALRVDGILRGLSGLYAGQYTQTQRDAIGAGFRPTGLIIYSTTNSRLEINTGTDASPSWVGIGSGSLSQGTFASRPAAAATNAGTFYLATDINGGTLYYSNGTTWTVLTSGVTHAAAHLGGGADPISWSTVTNIGTLASRPAAASSNNGYTYTATDQNSGTLYRSNGSSWVQIAAAVSGAAAPSAHASTHLAGAGDAIAWTTIQAQGTLAARPSPAAANAGYEYLVTDQNGGTSYISTGAAWVQQGLGVTQTPTIGAGSITAAMIVAGVAPAAGSAFPTTGLYNGYHYTIFINMASAGNGSMNMPNMLAMTCCYRADLDGTYPWHVLGMQEWVLHYNASYATGGWNAGAFMYAPRNGIYMPWLDGSAYSGSNGGAGFGIYQSVVAGYDLQEANGNNNWYGWSRHGLPRAMTGGSHFVQAWFNDAGVSVNYQGTLGFRPVKLI